MNLEDYLKQPLEFDAEINKYLNPNDDLVIFEIGACEGEDTIKLRRKFPNAEIYAFEPLPKNIKLMKQHYKQHDVAGIRVHQLAISDREGQAEFYVSAGHPWGMPSTKDWDYGNKSSSLLPPKKHLEVHPWLNFKDKIKVKTQRLDDFCQRSGIDRIDLAFIDVQGAELMVLQGAGKLLDQISAVWLEVENVELYSGQPLKNDVETFMKEYGFLRIMDTVDEIAGDQLYINKRTRKSSKDSRSIWKKLGNLNIQKRTDAPIINLDKNLRLYVPEDMSWAFSSGEYYEYNLAYWIGKIVRRLENPVFYDVGSNYGVYAITLARYCKQIYAFEPVRPTYDVLVSNIGLNKLSNILANEVALGSKNQADQINIYSSSGNNSIYNRQIPPDHPLKFVKTAAIETRTLDEYIKLSRALPPSIIKVDTEGSEKDFLKGAAGTIKEHMPIILMEYSINTAKDAGFERRELLNILEGFGYLVRALSTNTDDIRLYSPRSRAVDVDNLVAVAKNSKSLLM